MHAVALSFYAGSCVLLCAKFFTMITLQARERMRTRSFRYAEDAKTWRGEVAGDTDLCTRAQQVLRNDSEGQTYFFVLGGLYVALGAWPLGAPYYFAGYALSRVAHTYFLIHGRQPHRTHAFGTGLLILLALAIHVSYAAYDLALHGVMHHP